LRQQKQDFTGQMPSLSQQCQCTDSNHG